MHRTGLQAQNGTWLVNPFGACKKIFFALRYFRAKLNSIVEFDLKFLPVPVTAYTQTSTLRSR
jgi:hypothetical protein